MMTKDEIIKLLDIYFRVEPIIIRVHMIAQHMPRNEYDKVVNEMIIIGMHECRHYFAESMGSGQQDSVKEKLQEVFAMLYDMGQSILNIPLRPLPTYSSI